MCGHRLTGTIAAALIVCGTWPRSAADEPEGIPPPEQWVKVAEVSEEYDYVRRQRSPAGGKYEVDSQSTGVVGGRHYDQLVCKCTTSGETKVFTFDVTSIFEARAFADSKEAELKAHRELDRRFTKVTNDSLTDLQKLLDDRNPHYRTWAIARLAELKTPESDAILLDGYMRAGLLQSWKFSASLKARGEAILPLVEERLKAAKPTIPWSLLQVLEDIPTERSARILEGELQHALASNPRDKRPCYASLGVVASAGSAELLLKALDAEWPEPDDALVWALGRCRCQPAVARLRTLLDSDYEEGRLAAIYALGLLEDRESLPRLLEIAKCGSNHNARHNAILALGRLRAQEAVPLLIEYLQTPPSYDAHYHPTGQFETDAWTTQGNYVDASVRALGQIGDERALPEFRRILRHDRFYLNYDEVAAAAAELKWMALVPDIIYRLEKDYQHNVELFGKDRERYAPALRRLTGQSFGEDPGAWSEWLAKRSDQP
jgi:HEAT repeat protein